MGYSRKDNYDLDDDRHNESASSFGGDTGGAAPPANPLLVIHELLRGRYLWVILLAVVGGAAGAVGGFKFGERTYKSRGLLEVKPVIPTVVYGDEEKGVMPMFEAYVQGQETLLLGERVRDIAMQDAEWVALGRGASDETTLKFIKHLHANHEGGFIYVDFQDSDPVAARIATGAVIKAYVKLNKENEQQADRERMSVLEDKKANLEAELGSIRERILQLAAPQGSDNLESLYQFRLSQQQKLEEELASLTMQLAGIRGPTTVPAEGGPMLALTSPALSEEDIAKVDLEMNGLLSQKFQQEAKIRTMMAHGAGDKSPYVQTAREELASIEAEVARRATDYRAKHPAGTAAVASVAGGPAMTLDTLRSRMDELKHLNDDAQKKAVAIGQQDLQIKKYKTEADDLKAQLDTFKHRIEALKTEGTISGRIAAMNFGDRPLEPFQDTRYRYAAVGGGSLMLLGIGIIALIGASDRTLRFPTDANSSTPQMPILGILPELPPDLSDPEQASLASHCVHRIRSLLQIRGGPREHKVFGVTSPMAGTGKTSLTHALGVSFAQAGAKTLLIDCDMVGGGLTYRINTVVRRKLGRILRREGYITSEQAAQAIRLSKGAKRPLGQTLIELGLLNEATLAAMLRRQAKEPIGLLEVLRGEDIRSCIGATGTQNLDILPLGLASPSHVAKLSPSVARRIVEQARKYYDVVLIDTGPVPGSLEASIMASVVDGVVLTVSRGEQRGVVRQCLQHLSSIGASISGCVFNRARNQDITLYGTNYPLTSGGISSRAYSDIPPSDNHADKGRGIANPIVHAVVTRVPTGTGGLLASAEATADTASEGSDE